MFKKRIINKIVAASFALSLLLSGCVGNVGKSEQENKNSSEGVQTGGIIIVLSEPFMYLNDVYSWSAQLDLVTEELLKLVEKMVCKESL